jgi:dienelactone hydrolase
MTTPLCSEETREAQRHIEQAGIMRVGERNRIRYRCRIVEPTKAGAWQMAGGRAIIALAAFAAWVLGASAAWADEFVPVELASPLPSGSRVNDTIHALYLPPPSDGTPHPGVIILHSLGVRRLGVEKRLARRCRERGMGALVMELPFHLHRRPKGTRPQDVYVGLDRARAVQALEQGARDASACVDWLSARPEIDRRRIGIVGISLGAIIGDLVLDRDPRILRDVSILGGGDLPYLMNASIATAWTRLRARMRGIDPRKLPLPPGAGDPAADPPADARSRVYMLAARRDRFVPLRSTLALWEAYGEPPITWTRGGHFAPLLAEAEVFDAAVGFLERGFSGSTAQSEPPQIEVPLIRLGIGLGRGVESPYASLEMLGFGGRPHVYGSLRLSTDGPALGAEMELDPGYSIGFLWYKGHGRAQPVVSFHIAF